MNTDYKKKIHAPPTGRRYDSVADFLNGESIPAEIQNAVAELDSEHAVVNCLIQARKEVGLTQQQMAKRLKKTQSAISKLESSNDQDLTLAEIQEYACATHQTFSLIMGQPLNHIDSVKQHAFGIKKHLLALAGEAARNEEAEQAVQVFFGEAFFNILTILSKCHDEIPQKSGQIRFQKIEEHALPNQKIVPETVPA